MGSIAILIALVACGGGAGEAAPVGVGTGTETGTGTEAGTGTGTETETETETGAETEARTETEAATGTETRTEAAMGTEAGTEAATGTGTPSPPPFTAHLPPSGPGGPPPPHVLVTIQNATDKLSVIGRYRRLLATIRREVELPPRGATPGVCGSSTREDVNSLVREGYSETNGIRDYRRYLDELCDGFERWESPDEALQGRIRRFHNRLERIENWMKDIRTCIDPGPYDGRCENAYGPAGGRDARDALQAMRVIDEVRQVVDGVPERRRFPCRHPLWARIEARQWTQRVARAQMPHVPREARNLCEHIGVDEAELGELVQRIRDEVDRDDAQAAQSETRNRTTLTQLRAQYHLPD